MLCTHFVNLKWFVLHPFLILSIALFSTWSETWRTRSFSMDASYWKVLYKPNNLIFWCGRYLEVFKFYIWSIIQLERFITETYIAEECLTFCLRYLDDDIDTSFTRLLRNIINVDSAQQNSDTKSSIGRLIGSCEMFNLNEITWR